MSPCIVTIHGTIVQSSYCPQPLTANQIVLPKATEGQPYSVDISGSVSGGVKPYIFIATSDCDGLTLSFDGKLTGTPTKAGDFNLTWNVKDSAGTIIYVQ